MGTVDDAFDDPPPGNVRTAFLRSLAFSFRDVVWVVGLVVGGLWTFAELARRIDTATVTISAAVSTSAQTISFVEGRVTELRAALLDLTHNVELHHAAAGHPVALERTDALRIRVDALERDVRDLRTLPKKQAAYRVLHADLPGGRRIHSAIPEDDDTIAATTPPPASGPWNWLRRWFHAP